MQCEFTIVHPNLSGTSRFRYVFSYDMEANQFLDFRNSGDRIGRISYPYKTNYGRGGLTIESPEQYVSSIYYKIKETGTWYNGLEYVIDSVNIPEDVLDIMELLWLSVVF